MALSGVVLVVLGACSSGGAAEPTQAPASDVSQYGFPVYQGSEERWAEEFTACLEREGWVVSPADDPGGVFQVDVADGQDDAYFASLEACNESVGLPPQEPVNQEAAQVAYDASVQLRSCLVEQGLTMPTPPSFSRYWDDYQRLGAPAWDPVTDATENAGYRAAIAACGEGAAR